VAKIVADSTRMPHEDLRAIVLKKKPEWSKYQSVRASADKLNSLESTDSAAGKKIIIDRDPSILDAALDALAITEDAPVQWILTVLFDMLRDDSCSYDCLEDVLHKPQTQQHFNQALMGLLKRKASDQYIADKAAWILTAMIGNSPKLFKESQVKAVMTELLDVSTSCSELGTVEGFANLLKAGAYRKMIWSTPGVSLLITKFDPRAATPALLYKSVFALWMLSFDSEGVLSGEERMATQKIRDTLINSRSEKVVRLSLTVLRNLLPHRAFTEQVVELGVLEVVQQLEYEKWRDTELYDEIRDMTSQIATKVQEMSNFERYERELKDGRLKWGFIHSAKFWADNCLKFEQNDFSALKKLAALLGSSDPETQAVACHDLGEFVAMHPLGKKQISKLGVKEAVMQLLTSQEQEKKDVRREALLCCQKIMLNKWQEAAV